MKLKKPVEVKFFENTNILERLILLFKPMVIATEYPENSIKANKKHFKVLFGKMIEYKNCPYVKRAYKKK